MGQMRVTARICLLNAKKKSYESKIDDFKTKLSGAGWSENVSPVQMNEWKSSLEELSKAISKIDMAILSQQALVDGYKAKISDEKKAVLEQEADAAEDDADES